MSLPTPKSPRRFKGKAVREMTLRYRMEKARRGRLTGCFWVYQVARQINRAGTAMEVIQAVENAESPEACYVFRASPDGLSLQIPHQDTSLPIAIEHIESLLAEEQGVISTNLGPTNPATQTLHEALLRLGHHKAKLFPIRSGGTIAAVIMAGLSGQAKSSQSTLDLYGAIAEMAEMGLEKIQAVQSAQRPMAELEAFNFISLLVAGHTELEKLYPVIHKAISQILGQIDLIIALYDQKKQTIHIPYLYEHPNLLSVDPFPLGQGLTSILLHTRQPLLLTRDVENQAKQMGAIMRGKPPKSWLGVPLLVAGEPIGALVVQDLEQENRFSEDDQRLLISLGAQIAMAIYNAQLIEQSRLIAKRERMLHEVTSKIRSSTDMKTILATTATELGRALGVQSARIEVGLQRAPEVHPGEQAAGNKTTQSGTSMPEENQPR